MRILRWSAGVLALAAVLAAPGCGGKGATVKVQGKVTLDGEPLDNAVVKFIPASGEGPIASGYTGADGTFRLTTYNTGDGAVPGDYKVTVSKAEDEPAGSEVSIQGDPKAAAKDIYLKNIKSKKKLKAKSAIPLSYSDPKTTTLRQHVPPDGTVELPLRKQGG